MYLLLIYKKKNLQKQFLLESSSCMFEISEEMSGSIVLGFGANLDKH